MDTNRDIEPRRTDPAIVDTVAWLMPSLKVDLAELVAIPSISATSFREKQ